MRLISMIIPAAGAGKRMDSSGLKQFMLLGDKPVLMHTLEFFHRFDPEMPIVVAFSEEGFVEWERLMQEYNCSIPHRTILGGKERYDSVKAALKVVPESEFIGVHDAVRPFVNEKTFQSCIDLAVAQGSAVPVSHLPNSLRMVHEEGSKAVNREHFRQVHTPQIFRSKWLQEAYQRKYESRFFDDATLVEHAGFPIFLTENNHANIKITTKLDWEWSEYYLSERKNE